MDLNAFREEARDWLESNCPQAMRLGAVHFEDAYELYQTDEALEWRIVQPLAAGQRLHGPPNTAAVV